MKEKVRLLGSEVVLQLIKDLRVKASSVVGGLEVPQPYLHVWTAVVCLGPLFDSPLGVHRAM